MIDNALVDIAIVGGGLVGTPLALMLAKQGWSVALLEQQKPVAVVSGTKGYTALSDATVQSLKRWQLWEHAATDACAIREVHVSHKGYFGSTRINSEEHNLDALGYVVDNALFLDALQSSLQSSTVNRLDGATVVGVEHADAHTQLSYKRDGQQSTLLCRLLIAVDGVNSTLRDTAGIATKRTDYEQVGVLGAVQLSEDHNNVAFERFTTSGPLALLPGPNNTASFVYCINPDMQSSLEAMDDLAFLSTLQNVFGHRVGRFESIGKRVFVPLVRIEATQQVANRLVLLGNAMRLLHPVAGQGYNLAMRDVEALLMQLTDTQADPGDAVALQEFAQSRLQDHAQVVRMTDLLARTFRGKAAPLAHARALGLLGLDRITPLRKRFTKASMGHGTGSGLGNGAP